MTDIFDHEQTELDEQLAAVQALGRICQVTLAYLNAVAYLNSQASQDWNESMDRQIKAIHRENRRALWYQMEFPPDRFRQKK